MSSSNRKKVKNISLFTRIPFFFAVFFGQVANAYTLQDVGEILSSLKETSFPGAGHYAPFFSRMESCLPKRFNGSLVSAFSEQTSLNFREGPKTQEGGRSIQVFLATPGTEKLSHLQQSDILQVVMPTLTREEILRELNDFEIYLEFKTSRGKNHHSKVEKRGNQLEYPMSSDWIVTFITKPHFSSGKNQISWNDDLLQLTFLQQVVMNVGLFEPRIITRTEKMVLSFDRNPFEGKKELFLDALIGAQYGDTEVKFNYCRH